MKTDPFMNGIFGVPNGQCRSETPDGVSRSYVGGRVRSNAITAHYLDTSGHGYGGFPREGDSGLMWAPSCDSACEAGSGTTSAPGQIKVGED